MKLEYTVFSADRIMITRTVDIDGELTDVQAEGFSAQLTSPYGTIQLNLTKAQAADHPFVVGEKITVSFGDA